MHVFHTHTHTSSLFNFAFFKKAEMSISMPAAFLAVEGTDPRDRQWFNDSKQFDPEAFEPSRAGLCDMGTSSREFVAGSIPKRENEEFWNTFAKNRVLCHVRCPAVMPIFILGKNNMKTNEMTHLIKRSNTEFCFMMMTLPDI